MACAVLAVFLCATFGISHRAAMGVTNPNMDAEWLKQELEKPPRSQSDLARFLGMHHSKVNRMCSGERAIKAWEADRIREYLAETSGEALERTGGSRPTTVGGKTATHTRIAPQRTATARLPVRGTVEAGSWREAALLSDLDYESESPLVAPEWVVDSGAFALRVVGPSMDLLYPDGSLIVVQPWHGGPLPYGRRVIVERIRDGLVETTVKELVRGSNGDPELWPRSSHAAHQAPIPYQPSDTLRLVGVVSWVMAPG
jgi:SOS-response transcriptional repressor LexA